MSTLPATTTKNTTLTSGLIKVIRKKTAGSHTALHENIAAPVRVTVLVEVSKDAERLVVCTQKFFWLGLRVFCEWHHKWRTFSPPWPTSPGPGRQPLDGSILLKLLLETRLLSKSFDTLDDPLGFCVKSYDLSLWFPTFFISRPHSKISHKLATPFKNMT